MDLLNGWGITGLVVMLAGAVVSLAAKRFGERKIIFVKLAGLLLVMAGAVIIIAFGKTNA